MQWVKGVERSRVAAWVGEGRVVRGLVEGATRVVGLGAAVGGHHQWATSECNIGGWLGSLDSYSISSKNRPARLARNRQIAIFVGLLFAASWLA
jgi:hypothetical protein